MPDSHSHVLLVRHIVFRFASVPDIVPDYSLLYYFLFWFIVLSLSLAFILMHGIDYVSWPQLLPPTNIIYYSGPGYRSGHHGKGIQGRFEKLNLQPARWLTRGRLKGEEIELGMGLKKRVD